MHKLFSFLEVGREIVTPVLVINAYIFDCNLVDGRLITHFMLEVTPNPSVLLQIWMQWLIQEFVTVNSIL